MNVKLIGNPARKFARLDEMLVYLNLCSSISAARGFIRMGFVKMDDKIIREIHRLVPAGVLIDLNGSTESSRFGQHTMMQSNLKTSARLTALKQPIIFDGKPYPSQSEAERKTGTARGRLSRLIKDQSPRIKRITQKEFERLSRQDINLEGGL